MNDGFVRCTRLFLPKGYISFVTWLAFTVSICICFKGNLHESSPATISGAVAGFFSSIVFYLPIQHMHTYKAVRLFSITSKNYTLSSYATNIVSSLLSMATMWIILYFTNTFVFTPIIAVIVFFISVLFGLLAQFCGLLVYKGNTITGFAISFSIYIFLICVPIFLLFSNIAIPINNYLIAICAVSIALSASFFVINTLVARSLDLKN